MIALALSGGGSRAIAFHLGCLRALHDYGILERVSVISAVSGGSVITGMYAYCNEDFASFDQRVVDLLRRGLMSRFFRYLFSPVLLSRILVTSIVSSPLARATWLVGAQPPFRRWVSRTYALEASLEELFGAVPLSRVARPHLEVVFNACELRTGTAFRFGNHCSGSWRYGEIEGNVVSVAHAVACSAAYPLFLPAIDQIYRFRKGDEVSEKRVVITDGGIFDNLGLTCLEPGRDNQYSLHVYRLDHLICCSAGHGQEIGNALPFHFYSRMQSSFGTMFRKVQDAAFDRLHRHKDEGRIKGFILPYLGQQDSTLPFQPPDLIRREEVIGYPTDFRAMNKRDLQLLTVRGEQLTRILLDYFLPET